MAQICPELSEVVDCPTVLRQLLDFSFKFVFISKCACKTTGTSQHWVTMSARAGFLWVKLVPVFGGNTHIGTWFTETFSQNNLNRDHL